MITRELAVALRDAGLNWKPAEGDRFQLDLPDEVELEAEADVFTVSAMTIEARQTPAGTDLAFNGTTEWALDAIEEREAVWLPRLDQLLDLLGEHFIGITARSGGHVVRVRLGQREEEHVDVGVTDAVARAVLSVLDGLTSGG